MTPRPLGHLVSLLKLLADPTRLRPLGLVAERGRSVEELSALLSLTGPTVSHHPAKLRAAGLVGLQTEGTTHLYALEVGALRALNRDLLSLGHLVEVAGDVAGEAWEQTVLRDFLDGERLKGVPVARRKREVVLGWLASQFEPARRYPEKEVNGIISRHHPDAATLRRELIGHPLLARQEGSCGRV